MKLVKIIGSFIIERLVIKEGKIMKKAERSKYGFCW